MTNEELLKAAEMLKKHCEDNKDGKCAECMFSYEVDRGGYIDFECAIGCLYYGDDPSDWELDRI